MNTSQLTRRGFLAGMASGLAAGLLLPAHRAAAQPATPASPVALSHGDMRGPNILEALKRIAPQVRAGIARKKTVLIKPNFVNTENQLCSSHVECVEALVEFLAPMTDGEIVIAETPANGPLAEALDNFGFARLAKPGRVRFINLDEEPFQKGYLIDERHRPVPVRLASRLLDPDAYLISTAPLKTHDRAIVTLGLKNLTVGAILKDPGFRWGAGSQGGTDKHFVHGGPENQGIHYNLFTLAQRIRPDLTVLDGFEGMEHNGPISGTPVDHRIAVASTDWLAADRVAAELMGFDHRRIGYLFHAAHAGMGQTDMDRIEILGPPISDLARSYQPHDTIEQQYLISGTS